MVYNVTTFINNTPIKSEELNVKNKIVYEVLNRYIRNKDAKRINEEISKKVMN